LTVAQFARLMLLILPVAIALTLPMAALFSAASTYGRISGDNEFTACRASGINLHTLLLPTLMLSLLSATVTFAFVNYVIPRMVRNLNEFLGSDVTSLIHQRIQRPRGLTLGGKYRIHADEVLTSPDEPSRIVLLRVAFVEVEGRDWVRFGTAGQVQLKVEQDEAAIRVSGAMNGLSFYDRKDGRFADSGEEVLPRVELPSLVPPQIKFLTWGELRYFRDHPEEWPDVRAAVEDVKTAMARRGAYDAFLDEWVADHRFTIGDETLSYAIVAERAARIPHLGGIELGGVSIEENRAGRRRTLSADRAELEVTGSFDGTMLVRVDLRQDRDPQRPKLANASQESLLPVPVSDEILAPLRDLSTVDTLSVSMDEETVTKRQDHAQRVFGGIERRIAGTLHERLAFSISVFVLVVLGGALGIILRGTHVLTAFGISFVPLVFVIIAIVAGRQMANNATTHVAGLAVMWGGIALVALVDLWTVTRLLRR